METMAVADRPKGNESTFPHRRTLKPAVQGQDHGRMLDNRHLSSTVSLDDGVASNVEW